MRNYDPRTDLLDEDITAFVEEHRGLFRRVSHDELVFLSLDRKQRFGSWINKVLANGRELTTELLAELSELQHSGYDKAA